MPGGITDFGAQQWLAALFDVISGPSGYYVALCAAAPGVAADGDMLADLEPSGGGYSRQLYGVGSGNWGVSGNFLTNINPLAFPTPTADWGRVSHFALCSATSSGQVYAWGEFLNPQFVSAAYAFSIPSGGLSVAMTSFQNPITP